MHFSLARINSSLTAKLVIAISVFVLVGSALIWLKEILGQRKALMRDALSKVITFSDLTQKSLHHDMLTSDREAIQITIAALGTSKAITSVRIINTNGLIVYSSHPGEINRQANMSRMICSSCHKKITVTPTTPVHSRKWTIRQGANGKELLSVVDTIANEPSCSTAPCHVHSAKDAVLGFLISDLSLTPIQQSINRQIRSISTYIFLIVVIMASVLSVILWRLVIRPIHTLTNGMKRVSAGDLSSRINFVAKDEIGILGHTFNEMSAELAIARRRMLKWTQSLEEEVAKKAKEIKETQDKLIQAEKMAALGRMTADIAHEIRNPLTALGGFGRRLQKEATTAKQRQYAALIVEEADRLEHILKDVLTFSWEPRFHFEKVPLTETVSAAVKIFDEMLTENEIILEEHYNTEFPVLLEKDHVRQAILNLLANSLDAMDKGGILSVTTEQTRENDLCYVAVHIADTGPGIAEEKLEQVFEPFYTTKKIGQGTGLGLAICRKIVTEHGGFVRLKNRESGGLTASLYFPCQPEEELGSVPCWEFMHCGRDKDNSVKCPAYPHFGRACWAVAGTLCAGKVQGTYAQKLEDCRKCPFYQAIQSDKKDAD
ncbi:MAG: HAMP domain-containing sensor histidine kinase [Deltaproteobacteria bacterium]